MVDTNNKSWMYTLDELASLFITHYDGERERERERQIGSKVNWREEESD